MTRLPAVFSRREFVRRSACVSAAVIVSQPRAPHRAPERSRPTRGGIDSARQDPAPLLALARQALDVATAAGAQYADVRFTRTIQQGVTFGKTVIDSEELAVGVRALVRGTWGFAASPVWTPDELTRLAREATSQATVNATTRATSQPVNWPARPAAVGTWIMPGRDPLDVTIEEKLDTCQSWEAASADQPRRWFGWGSESSIGSYRQERTFASTDGGACHQVVYNTGGGFTIREGIGIGVEAKGLELAGLGWEHITDARVIDQIPAMLDELDRKLKEKGGRPLEIGRYTTLFGPQVAASLLDCTLGFATQLDCALGYNANDIGSSYLGPDPLALLGTPVTSPLLTVTANRSLPGGLATVRWDDEGSAPEDFTLVQQGVLMDYQTTREQATWLAPWYARQRHAAAVHGCTATETALSFPRQHIPNLAITPGPAGLTLEALAAQVGDGMAVLGGLASTDWQGRTGSGSGEIRRIKHGKIGELVTGTFRFTGPKLWKDIVAVGGLRDGESVPGEATKGQPSQTTRHTISAVPVVIANLVFLPN